MQTININLFRFISIAYSTIRKSSRKFSILENFTHRELQKVIADPVPKVNGGFS